MDTNPTPPRIEGMEIVDVIARGGQSTVYRARRLIDGADVALKVHDSRPLADAIRRFERELGSLQRLAGHPGVVQLLGSGATADGDRYLVLELADGGTLADHLRAGPLSIDEATAIVIGLCRAVEAAHDAEIIHRDLKPANVVRASDGNWKLADFGVAELMDGDRTTTLQVSMGHVAPEILDGAGAGRAADVYSLASILFTLLTGSEPFARRDDESMAATVHRLATTDVPDPRAFGVPSVLARLIEAGLDKEPLRRPVSAWFLGGALEAARRELGLAPVPASSPIVPADDATMIVHWAESSPPVAGSPDAPEPRPRRARWLVAAAVVAAMLGFGAFGLAGLQDADEQVAAPAVAAVDVGLVDADADADADDEVEADGAEGIDEVAAAQADEPDEPDEADGDGGDGNANDGGGDGNADNGNGNGNGNDGDGDDGGGDGNDNDDDDDGDGGRGRRGGRGGNGPGGGDGNGPGGGGNGGPGGGPGGP